MTTNGLLKPNEELKVHTKQDDEFIIDALKIMNLLY